MHNIKWYLFSFITMSPAVFFKVGRSGHLNMLMACSILQKVAADYHEIMVP